MAHCVFGVSAQGQTDLVKGENDVYARVSLTQAATDVQCGQASSATQYLVSLLRHGAPTSTAYDSG
jgi:hypothetical protein